MTANQFASDGGCICSTGDVWIRKQTTAAAHLDGAMLLAAAVASAVQGGGHGSKPSVADGCAAIAAECAARGAVDTQAAALCSKSVLTTRLRDNDWVTLHHGNGALYFLCSAREYATVRGGGGSPRSATLTSILRAATASGSVADLEAYRSAAKWSGLSEWSADEVCGHFLDVLAIHPDNTHAIDRLAVALGEAQDEPHRRARRLLLHYAVLRGLFLHPLQRPLDPPVPGLRGRPWWRRPGLPAAVEVEWAGVLEAAHAKVLAELTGAELGTSGIDGLVGGRRQSEGIHLDGEWTEVCRKQKKSRLPIKGPSQAFPPPRTRARTQFPSAFPEIKRRLVHTGRKD